MPPRISGTTQIADITQFFSERQSAAKPRCQIAVHVGPASTAVFLTGCRWRLEQATGSVSLTPAAERHVCTFPAGTVPPLPAGTHSITRDADGSLIVIADGGDVPLLDILPWQRYHYRLIAESIPAAAVLSAIELEVVHNS